MEKLSNAITEALENSQMKENARKLGQKIRKEKGLKSAVKAIESVINKTGNKCFSQ